MLSPLPTSPIHPSNRFSLCLSVMEWAEEGWLKNQKVKVLVTQSCSTLCDPMDYSPPTRLLSPMGFPRHEYWVGCCALLQGVFLTQELNPGLLHCGHILKPWRGRRVHGAYNMSWNRRPLVKSQLWPQTSHLTSLGLSSLTYETGIVIASPENLVVMTKWANIAKLLTILRYVLLSSWCCL